MMEITISSKKVPERVCHVFSEMRRCVPVQLEKAIISARILENGKDLWTTKAREGGIFFDLSRVIWADIGAITQVILLCERALRDSVNVYVALPNPEMRKNEALRLTSSTDQKIADSAARQRTYRGNCLRFLNYLGFSDALCSKHLMSLPGTISIIPTYDNSISDDINIDEEIIEFYSSEGPRNWKNEDWSYRVILPLSWVSTKFEDTQKSLQILGSIISSSDRGISQVDADTVQNVILNELVENTQEHAGKNVDHVLITAFARSGNTPGHPMDYHLIERNYLTWVFEVGTPFVDVVVGDSGLGIVKTLTSSYFDNKRKKQPKRLHLSAERTILDHAVGKWSSRFGINRARNTRGLYRVHRVVRKYSGHMLLRCGRAEIAYDHGSGNETLNEKQRLANLPGSLVRIRLSHRDPTTLPARTSSHSLTLQPFIVSLGRLDVEKRYKHAVLNVDRELQKHGNNSQACVIAAFDGGVFNKQGLTEMIQELIERRHPPCLVVCGLPGTRIQIDECIDAVNQLMQRDHEEESHAPRNYSIWDPVLIIGAEGHFGWAGVGGASSRVLEEILKREGLSLTRSQAIEIGIRDSDFAEVARQFLNEPGIAHVTKDKIRLLLSPLALTEIIERQFTSEAERRINNKIPTKGILLDGPYLSPNLSIVNNWVHDTGSLVHEVIGDEGILLTLCIGTRLLHLRKGKPVDLVVGEREVGGNRLYTLASELGARAIELPGELGDPLGEGAGLIQKGEKIVIFTDVFRSGEATRRLVKEVIRLEGDPAAIAVLLNASEPSVSEVSVWGWTIPVVPFACLKLGKSEGLEKAKPIHPRTRLPENKSDRVLSTESVLESREWFNKAVSAANALHFTHLGRPANRHFTFYFDLLHSMNNGTFVRSCIKIIKEWWDNELLSKGKLEIWYPISEIRSIGPAAVFVEKIVMLTVFTEITSRPIPRSIYDFHWEISNFEPICTDTSGIVVFDWGAISGSTLLQLSQLAALSGAEAVLCLALMDQTLQIERMNFTSIKGLKRFPPKYLKSHLFPPVEIKDLAVAVDEGANFTRFTFNAVTQPGFRGYTPFECPVCRYLTSIVSLEPPTDWLKEHISFLRGTVFKLRDRSEIIRNEPLDLLGNPRTIESENVILIWRYFLEDAHMLTSKRLELSQLLNDLLLRLRRNDMDAFKTTSSLLELLTLENHWLRRAPLSSPVNRKIVAELAAIIAIDYRAGARPAQLCALIVLRTASKEVFAENFAKLIVSTSKHLHLTRQLLLDAFTFFRRRRKLGVSAIEPMVKSLREVWQQVENGELQLGDNAEYTLFVVKNTATASLSQATLGNLEPSFVWKKLRTTLEDNFLAHRPIPVALERLHVGPVNAKIIRECSDIKQKPTLPEGFRQIILDASSNWLKIATFMDELLVPLLCSLRKSIQSPDFQEMFGLFLGKRIEEWLIDKSPFRNGEFMRQLDILKKNPELILHSGNGEKYLRAVDWFRENVFQPHEALDRNSTSKLFKALLSIPSNLNETIDTMINQANAVAPIKLEISITEKSALNTLVFCPEQLLQMCVFQILENAWKHWDKTSNVKIEFDIDAQESQVYLSTSTSGTEQDNRPKGRGYREVLTRLRFFDADVKYKGRSNNPEFTFNSILVFVRM